MAAPPAAPPLRILWGEDSPAEQQLIRAAMQELGATADVRFVESGQEVLAGLDGPAFDLVVLDIDLHGLDGLAVLRHIRGAPATKDQAVVLFTSHYAHEFAEADLRACTAYVQKPVAFSAFVAAVGQVLRTKVRPPGARSLVDRAARPAT